MYVCQVPADAPCLLRWPVVQGLSRPDRLRRVPHVLHHSSRQPDRVRVRMACVRPVELRRALPAEDRAAAVGRRAGPRRLAGPPLSGPPAGHARARRRTPGRGVDLTLQLAAMLS
jgi:hypothetical protein